MLRRGRLRLEALLAHEKDSCEYAENGLPPHAAASKEGGRGELLIFS